MIDRDVAKERHAGPLGPLEAIVVLGGVQILTMTAGLARTKILAVVLGPAGLGITSVIDQLVAFLAHLGAMSLPFAALRTLSKYRGSGGEALRNLYFAFWRALRVASFVSLVGGLAFVWWKVSNSSSDLAPYSAAVILGLLAIPAMASASLDRNVLAVFDRSRMAGIVAMLTAVALVGSSYAGLRLGNVTGLYAGNLVVQLGLALLLAVYVRRHLIEPHVSGLSRPSSLSVLRGEPGLVKFCTLIHLITLSSPAAYLISRVVMLDSRGAAETGLMTSAFGLGVAVRTAMNQANALYLTPLVNRPTSVSDRAEAVSHYARTLSVAFLLAVLPVVLFPGVFLTALYSGRFVSASGSVGTFLVAEGLLLMAGVYQSLLIGFDDLNGYSLMALIANVVTIVASLAFIPAFGIIGCAVAFVCGNGLLLVLTMARLAVSHSVPGLLAQTRLFLLGLLLLLIASWWVFEPSRAPLSLRLLAGLAGYAALLPLLSFAEIRAMFTPRRAK